MIRNPYQKLSAPRAGPNPSEFCSLPLTPTVYQSLQIMHSPMRPSSSVLAQHYHNVRTSLYRTAEPGTQWKLGRGVGYLLPGHPGDAATFLWKKVPMRLRMGQAHIRSWANQYRPCQPDMRNDFISNWNCYRYGITYWAARLPVGTGSDLISVSNTCTHMYAC